MTNLSNAAGKKLNKDTRIASMTNLSKATEGKLSRDRKLELDGNESNENIPLSSVPQDIQSNLQSSQHGSGSQTSLQTDGSTGILQWKGSLSSIATVPAPLRRASVSSVTSFLSEQSLSDKIYRKR